MVQKGARKGIGHSVYYEQGKMGSTTFHSKEDILCTTYNLGAVMAVWGNEASDCTFLVNRVAHTLLKDYSALAIDYLYKYELVTAGQLCCHEPFHIVDAGASIGTVCALSCAPTFFGRL